MIRILDKGTILRLILPHLSVAKRGYRCSVSLVDVVSAILYKFKSGCQWHMLPVDAFFKSKKIKALSVYYHFRKWALDGSWRRVARVLMRYNPQVFDLSLAHFDGTHSRVIRGGKVTGYQRRRRSKTTNTLWLVDRNGLVVSYLQPIAGNHNDLYNIENGLLQMAQDLKSKGVSTDGLFINADAGFDSESLRHLCERMGIQLNCPFVKRNNKHLDVYDWHFDSLMYQERFTVERTNAWMDAFRTLSVRYDTSIESWIAWHDIFCVVAWCRKISKV
ncbi:MAG: IS5 family transposase [Bacteroidota bacterium]